MATHEKMLTSEGNGSGWDRVSWGGGNQIHSVALKKLTVRVSAC